MNPTFRLKRFSQLDPAGPLQSTDVIPLGRPDKDYKSSFAEVAERIKEDFRQEILTDLVDELQNILSSRVATRREVAILKTSGTWTAPENIIGEVYFRMVGAGASGNVSANVNAYGVSGLPGGYAEGWFQAEPEVSYSYTVGAGGPARPLDHPAPSPGLSGGDTSIFGVTAHGGPGSSTDDGPPYMGGGVTGPATVKIQNAIVARNPEVVRGGTPFGVQPFGSGTSGTVRVDSAGYGVGGLAGATGTSDSYQGTDGKPGLIILEYFTSERED